MNLEDSNLVIPIILFIYAIIAGYIGLKFKPLKKQMDDQEDTFKENKKAVKVKLEKIDERLRATETDFSVLSNQVKSIFIEQEKMAKATAAQLDKIERNMAQGFKDITALLDRRDEKYTETMKELEKNKQDKK